MILQISGSTNSSPSGVTILPNDADVIPLSFQLAAHRCCRPADASDTIAFGVAIAVAVAIAIAITMGGIAVDDR